MPMVFTNNDAAAELITIICKRNGKGPFVFVGKGKLMTEKNISNMLQTVEGKKRKVFHRHT